MKLRKGDQVSIPQDIVDISGSAGNDDNAGGSVNGRYYSHCDPCNKSFIRPGDLKRHNNYCHGGQLELRNDTLYPPGQQQNTMGKNHALKKYDQLALNTSYFWGSRGSGSLQ